MKTIEQMLRYLVRSNVSEFAVVTDRLPCIKVDGTFQPVDDVAPNTDVILQMLVSAGGSRYVDSLGPKPVQWSMRLDGIGQIAVNAMMRDEVVQARFKLVKRDPRAEEDPMSLAPDALIEDDQPSIRPAPVPVPKYLSAPPIGVPPPPSSASAMGPPPSSGSVADVDFGPALELDTDRGAIPAAAAPQPVMSTFEPSFELGSVAPPPQPIVARASSSANAAVSAPRTASNAAMAAATAPRTASNGAMAAVAPMIAAAPATAPGRKPQGLAELLALARRTAASDLHVVPERPALLRIAGELVPHGEPIDTNVVEKIVLNLVPGRLHATLEKDGSCDFAIQDPQGRCRVNVSRQRTGLKICIRLIPAAVPTLASLGLPPQIANATHHHQGLILVTGPTGHGKTSTLAAIVDIINSETTHHVITVEDPVEYVHPRKRAMMSQREVGAHTRSFAAALKGSLREDPDVIVVGELRDTETVRMALSASETGHLVIGTMNTPSAAKTIDRVIDLFPPGDQAQVRLTLAGGLRLIVSQRLIPNADGTGLVAACELLPGSISLWSLIRDNKTYQIPSLQQRGKGLGITRFDDSLVDLVKERRTTLEIAKQWAESPDEFEMTALGKKPQVALPLAPSGGAGPSKPIAEGAKDAIGGLFGKAGNLFRKG